MNTTNINIGSKVEHLNDGRRGEVIDLETPGGTPRARVRWTHTFSGQPFDRNLRTWIRFADLKVLP